MEIVIASHEPGRPMMSDVGILAATPCTIYFFSPLPINFASSCGATAGTQCSPDGAPNGKVSSSDDVEAADSDLRE